MPHLRKLVDVNNPVPNDVRGRACPPLLLFISVFTSKSVFVTAFIRLLMLSLGAVDNTSRSLVV